MQTFIITASMLYGFNALIISILISTGLFSKPRSVIAGMIDMLIYAAMMVWGLILIGKG